MTERFKTWIPRVIGAVAVAPFLIGFLYVTWQLVVMFLLRAVGWVRYW